MTRSYADNAAGAMVMCMIVGAPLAFHGARMCTGRAQ
jgi:hypothetical protein